MKFISCNIEGNKHFERLLPFLQAEKPDVLCLQEVFECDLPILRVAAGLQNFTFCPQALVSQTNPHLPSRGLWGVAILANQISDEKAQLYTGNPQVVPEFFANQDPNSMNRCLISAQVQVAGTTFQLATTHFTWSGEGVVNDEQRLAYSSLKLLLANFEELIFCGDFNTPRGYEIWSDLAKRYTDNIPASVTTTIDKNLHKSGFDIQLVIDGLFTSAHYVVREVRVVPNTSDHLAVVAEIERVS
jgi:endonuclease/exonuclease/phosphatase family metal-dependent hydrolase